MMENRNLNIECVRIVSMFLIVMGHIFVGFIPLSENASPFFRYTVPSLIFFIPFHVNAFVLISGYCGIKKLRGVVKAWKLVFSYLLLIAGLNLVMNWGDFDYSSLIFPLSRNPWWFMQIYVLLVLLAPTLLEPLLAKMSRRDLLKLIAAMMIVDVYFGFVCHMQTVHNGGYDLIHFLNIYLIGAFLRTIDVRKLRFKGHLLCARHWAGIFMGLIVMKLLYHAFMKAVGMTDWFVDYNHPFNIALAVCFFIAFLNLQITNRKVQWVSGSVIGVYLLQEHPLIRSWLMKEFDNLVACCQHSIVLEMALVPVFVAAIFVAAILIDKIRICGLQLIELSLHGLIARVQNTKK